MTVLLMLTLFKVIKKNIGILGVYWQNYQDIFGCLVSSKWFTWNKKFTAIQKLSDRWAQEPSICNTILKCTVWNVHSEIWILKCTVWNVHSEMCILKYTVWNVQSEMCILKCTVWNVRSEMYSLKCTVWNVPYEMYSLKWQCEMCCLVGFKPALCIHSKVIIPF